MSKVKTYGNGFGYSTATETIYIDMSAFTEGRKSVGALPNTVPPEIAKHQPWSPWGVDNLLPAQYVRDITNTGIVTAIIEGKARFGVCQGLVPAIMRSDDKGQRVIEKILDSGEVFDFLEMNNHFQHTYEWFKDLVGFSWGAGRFKLNTALDKIVAFQRDDLTEVRFGKKDKRTKKIEKLWYSAEWALVQKEKDERVFSCHYLNPLNPVLDLQQKAARGITDHAFTFGSKGWGNHYYPVPLWMAVQKWIKIAQGVPEMKAALFQNAMRPKKQVIIAEEYWEERYGDEWGAADETEKQALKQKFYDECDLWLVGGKNANKAIFTKGELNEKGELVATTLRIEDIPDTTQKGELLPDSAAANSEIAIAMLWNNAMNGGNQKGGMYESSRGGSDIRESLLMQVIMLEAERQQVRQVMNIVKYFNKWNEKYKGLDFIVPATILTTTDTGGSTKPVVTGDAKPKEDADKKQK